MINLKCLNCAATLEISPDMTIFACGYCGSQQMVERRGGTVALKAVTDAIDRVQVGTDKTAAELALKRLEKEVKELKEQRGRRKDLGYHELDLTTKPVLWMGLGGLIIGAIVSNSIRVDDDVAVIISIVCGVAALATGMYKKSNKDKIIKERTREDLSAIDYHISTARQKIEKNRQIAES